MAERAWFRASALAIGCMLLIAVPTFYFVGRLRGELTGMEVPTRAPVSGTELVAVFLINESCFAAGSTEFRNAIRIGLKAFEDSGEARGVQTSLMGVALAPNTVKARRFIANFGQFDEIVVGRGWLNSGAIRFFWRDFPGVAGVPQLIVFRRTVIVRDSIIDISPDSVLFRLSGAQAIINWSRAGSPIEL